MQEILFPPEPENDTDQVPETTAQVSPKTLTAEEKLEQAEELAEASAGHRSQSAVMEAR